MTSFNFMENKLENKYFLYLRLQTLITYRKIKDFGLPPYAFLFFLIFILFYGIYKIALLEDGIYINLVLYIILRTLSFTHKSDIEIVNSNFKNPKILFLIESGIILIPFLVINLLFENYLISVTHIIIATIYGLCLIPFRSFSVLNKLNLSFLMIDYEWIYGFRKYFYILPLSITLVLIGINSGNSNIAFSGSILFYILLLQFYNLIEPPIIIWQHHKSNDNFVHHKITSLSKKLIVIGVPLTILYGVLFFDSLATSIILIISMSVSTLNQMLIKYAFYSDRSMLLVYQALSFILGVLALFFYPVLILNIMLFFYVKGVSIKSMKKLLYVENI